MKRVRVKFSGFWKNDENLFHDIKLFSNGEPNWKNIEIVNTNDFDFLVVLTRPYNYKILEMISPDKVLLFLTEPLISNNVDKTLIEEYNVYPWEYFFIPSWTLADSKQLDQIWSGKSINKKFLFSSVCSELYNDNPVFKGYFHRLRFLDYLNKRTNGLLDLYGRKYNGAIFNRLDIYKGEVKNKYDALIPYRYHFNCENSYLSGYYTEKLVDSIFAECLCFYAGCPDIDGIIDSKAFVRLELEDPEKSLSVICKAIETNEYGKRLGYIKKEKQRLLSELNPLNKVWSRINN